LKKGKRALVREALTAKKCAEALDWRLRGLTYRQIAEQMGVSHQTAHNLVEKALLETAKQRFKNAETYIGLEIAKLDRLEAKANAEMQKAEKAEKGDPGAVFAAIALLVKLSGRRCRLMGLDAPARAEITGRGGGPIQHGVLMVPGAAESLEQWAEAVQRQQAALAMRGGQPLRGGVASAPTPYPLHPATYCPVPPEVWASDAVRPRPAYLGLPAPPEGENVQDG
jgi:transcriptional regulator with XRE-family HTH domain